jgi:hypothetical protein
MKGLLLPVPVLIGLAAGCASNNHDSAQSACEAAYDAGWGNAEQRPRAAWVAECVVELGDGLATEEDLP